MLNFTKQARIAFFFLTLLTGIFLLTPSITYQKWLSTGDHGKNLYAAFATMQGQSPYTDYLWFYGPLMPSYYAAFLKQFGINISSVLLGQMVLRVISGVCIYVGLQLFTAPLLAFAGALWFWVFAQDFFYTYNHSGGVTLSLMTICCLLSYIRFQKKYWLYFGLAMIIPLSLVKLNIGLAVWTGFFLSTFWTHKVFGLKIQNNLIFFLTALCTVPLILGLYWLNVRELPFYAIQQCLHYFGNDAGNELAKTDILNNILRLGKSTIEYILSSWFHIFFWFIVVLSLIYNTILAMKKDTELRFKHTIIILIPSLILFYALNLHEYLLSGVNFRMYWSDAYSVILLFLVIGLATHMNKRWIQHLLALVLIGIAGLHGYYEYKRIETIKVPAQYLTLNEGGIFTTNSPQWIQTVTETTQYLQENLKPDERFFALPYDPLYYFLTQRLSPTRQLAFFDFLNIPEEQERRIIYELQNEHVNWILISNRSISKEQGAQGIFGETYGTLIAKYLEDHFEQVEEFGTWEADLTWAWNHGVRIYKRKSW